MAANDHNQCGFIGRLTSDPEQRFTTGAEPQEVSNFTLANNWKTSRTDGVEWVKCVAYRKLAEICNEHLKKGQEVFVQGRMRTRKWQDKDGRDRYSTEIHLDLMQMLGKKSASPGNEESPAPGAGSSGNHFDDDIPF